MCLPKKKYPCTIGPSVSAINTFMPVAIDLYLWRERKSNALRDVINWKLSDLEDSAECKVGAMPADNDQLTSEWRKLTHNKDYIMIKHDITGSGENDSLATTRELPPVNEHCAKLALKYAGTRRYALPDSWESFLLLRCDQASLHARTELSLL